MTSAELTPKEAAINITSRGISLVKSIRGHLPGILVFLARRLGFAVLVILFIIFLSYLGLDMASGTEFGPAVKDAGPDTLAYVQRLLQGDLGMTRAGSESLRPRPVIEMLKERFPRSVGLLGASLALASLIGIPLGFNAARNRSERSLGILISTLIGISIPSFFAAFLLQWLVTTLTRQAGRQILPVGGFGWDKHLILPMIVLAARPIAQITRITFVSVRSVLDQDYIRTAYSKGLRRERIMSLHVFRNAAIAILTTIGVSLSFSLSSLPVVEYFFGWPGVGFTLLKSIAKQDTNLTVGLALSLGLLFVMINLLLELSYRLIDPRLIKTPDHIASIDRLNPFSGVQQMAAEIKDIIADNPIIHWFKSRRENGETYRELPRQADLGKKSLPTNSETLTQRKPNWIRALKNIPFVAGSLLVIGLIVAVLLGPYLAPNNPFHTEGLVWIDGELTPPPFAPNEVYPWGTDGLGRGILSLILSGAQQTLILALLAVGARALVGVILGALAGWNKDSLLDRLILGSAEVISAFPTLLLAMILILAVGIRQGLSTFIIALCFVGWGEIMQFVRGEVISTRPKLFIESAVAVGVRTPRIIFTHIIPNLFSSLISIISLEMSAVLMLLGELGFLGIFIGGGSRIALPSMFIYYSDIPEWGALLSDVRYLARSYPWTAIYPMLAFFVSILGFNLFGEGVRRLIEEGNLVINRIFNRYTLALTVLGILGFNWLRANSGSMPFYKIDAQAFSGQRAMQEIDVLTDPRMYGRALGTPGIDLAAIYLAQQFEELGVQHGGQNASYFQERRRAFEILDQIPELKIGSGISFVYRQDFAVYPGLNVSDGTAKAPIKLIGLGQLADAPTGGTWHLTYPELERADFSEEILMVLSEREAAVLARKRKAGLLVVCDDPIKLRRQYTLSGRTGRPLNLDTGERRGAEIPYLWISEDTANQILATSGYTVDQTRERINKLGYEELLEIPLDETAEMEVHGRLLEYMPVKNVIGLVPGQEGFDLCADCLGKKLIVVMAQYDAPPPSPQYPFLPAANDNASGVAVMLEAMRLIQETGYEPYKSFLFVAYSGEGLDGGEPASDPDVKRFLQASTSFSNFDLEAIVKLRGVGGGSGERLQISAAGSLRLAKLFERSANQMGVRVIRSEEPIDIGVIYDESVALDEPAQEAPVAYLSWEEWQNTSRLPFDTIENISIENLEDAGKTLALSLMVMGRETQY